MPAAAPLRNRDSEVIYQVYPASFKDSDGDGHGDLRGVTEKLDYIKSLGVDALWISPFFLSPAGKAGDGGYAITDYRAIDPHFGTMAEFERLLEEAHKRGLRVYTDFVVCHTSNEHDWFKKSVRREPGFEDRYVWHDGKRDAQDKLILWDGHPVAPNNWLSVFGDPETGKNHSAWSWNETRGQFFLHHFNDSQPSLNLNDPAVQQASLDEMKFWLDKGVDGLRLDALPYANYDPLFRNNPKRNVHWNGDDWEGKWAGQDFTNSMCQPETVKFASRIREMLDTYNPPKRALGEVVAGKYGGDGSMEEAAKYLDPKTGLTTCYAQSLVQFFKYPEAAKLKDMIRENIARSPDGGFCINLGNHDFPRFASRMMNEAPYELHDAITKQLMSLAVSLPGSFCMYQGEELGLTQASQADLKGKRQDKVAIECRDPCRTPMPWEANQPNAGFSVSLDPYLPVPEGHLPLAVDVQENQSESMLNFTRRVLQQRNDNPALKVGRAALLKTPDDVPVVAFTRQAEGQTVLCLFNMSGRQVDFNLSPYLNAETRKQLKIPENGRVHLGAYASSFHGLYPPSKGIEQGMAPAQDIANGNGNGHNERQAKRIFAADMLIADNHLPMAGVERSINGILPDFREGVRGTINGSGHAKLEQVTAELMGETLRHTTPGGATSCTLWTLKKLLGDTVDINLLGLAADERYGQSITGFLKDAGIRLLGEWPEGMARETAVTHVIHHHSGKSSPLTYPGTGVEGITRNWAQRPGLLEECVRNSDIVYLPESTMEKFGLPFTNRLLDLRWKHKKELVLTLPSHANFGPSDKERFKFLIPSCNVVVGNDVEFCRILDKEIARPVSEEQMARVVAALQKEFEKETLVKEGMPCSPYGQVAFITRGDKPALLVTKDGKIEIPTEQVEHVRNTLGTGYTAFAGFLAGYIGGMAHEESADFAMKLAAKKAAQPGPSPYLITAEQEAQHLHLPANGEEASPQGFTRRYARRPEPYAGRA